MNNNINYIINFINDKKEIKELQQYAENLEEEIYLSNGLIIEKSVEEVKYSLESTINFNKNILTDNNINNINICNIQKISIISTGYCVGNNKILNKELENKFNLEEGWIKQRTGIESRYILNDNQDFHELIINACNHAIKEANINSTLSKVIEKEQY